MRVLFRYGAPSTPPEGELTGIARLAPLQDTISYPLPLRGLPLSQRESADSSIAEPSSPLREGLGEAALYKLAFPHGNEYYSRLLGLPYDAQCKNVGRISTIAYDEEVYYNSEAVAFVIEPEEKKPVGRPKGVKSKKLRVKSCAAAVLRELEQRGVAYGPGSHNKYISDACYMMNRYGVTESDCTKWALEKFSDYSEAGNDVASIVRSCYQQTEEHGTIKPPRAEKESRYATTKDIQEWLRSNDIRIRHNVITRKREVMNVDANVNDNQPSGSQQLTSALPLPLNEYQDSG